MLLAMIGSIWAFAGIAGWYVAIEAFRYVETAVDLLRAVFTVILLLSGYWIWFGWLRYSIKRRFPLVSVHTFWLLSLLHHSLCILYLLPMDVWGGCVWGGGDDPQWIPAWTIANIVVALVFLILPPPGSMAAPDQASPEEWP